MSTAGCPDIAALERADEEVAAHLRACAACRELQEIISRRRVPCEEAHLLMATSELDPDDAARLEAHLNDCTACWELRRLEEGAAAGEATSSRYAMGEELGKGGMGHVYSARDRQLERQVAIKVLRPGLGPEAAERFRREALVTAQLQHPSIAPIYELGHLETGEVFYAMRQIQGDTLERRVLACGSDEDRLALLPTLLAAAEAVAYAHNQGFLHRDLKPSNVMLGPFGETMVVDWGLARSIDEVEVPAPAAAPRDMEAAITRTGQVMGTPAFMAPEQAWGDRVDRRTDVYALGAILYFLLAGRPPHAGDSGDEVLARVRTAAPVPVAAAAPSAPRELRAIVAKAMALEPEERYQSAGRLAEDLRSFLTGKLVAAHDYSRAQLLRRWLARHRTPVAALAVLVVVLAAVGGVSVRRIVDERDRARAARAEADAERRRAEGVSRELLQEHGRQLLLDEQPLAAAVHLAEIYRASADTPAMRFLMRRSMTAVDARAVQIDLQHSSGTSERFSPDGRLLAAATGTDVRVWQVASGALEHVLPVPEKEAIVWSGDGRRLATGVGPVSVWDMESGEELRRIDGPVSVHALDRAGERLYAAAGGRIEVWQVASGERLGSTGAGSADCYWIGLSPDGGHLVTSGDDGVIRFLDPDTLQLQARIGSPGAPLHISRWLPTGGLFDPAGRILVFGPGADAVSLWRVGGSRPEVVLGGHEGAVLSAALGAAGQVAATASADGSVRVWEVQDGQLLHVVRDRTGPVFADFVGPSDAIPHVLASSPGHRTTSLYDVLGGARIARYDGIGVANRGGGRFLLAGDSGSVLVSPTDNDLREIAPIGSFAPPRRAPGGERVVSHDFDNGQVWDARSGRLLEDLRLHSEVRWLGSLAPDGSRVLEPRQDGSVVVRAIREPGAAGEPAVLATLDARAEEIAVAAFSPEGDWLVIYHHDRTGSIWDARSGRKVAALEVEGGLALREPPAVGPGAERVVTLRPDGGADLWDRRGRRIAELRDPGGPLVVARFLAHGESFLLYVRDERAAHEAWTAEPLHVLVATLRSARDGALVARLGSSVVLPYFLWGETDPAGRRLLLGSAVWDTVTGERILAPTDRTPVLRSGSFSEDGSLVAFGGGPLQSTGARVVEVATGRVVAHLARTSAPILYAQLSPAGDRVALSAADGSLSLWDVASGAELGRIPSPPARWSVHSTPTGGGASVQLAFSVFGADGRLLFTAGPGNATRVWDVSLETRSPEQIRRLVRARVPLRLDAGRLVPAEAAR